MDASDDTFCRAFTDGVLFPDGEQDSSVTKYLETQVAECDAQEAHYERLRATATAEIDQRVYQSYVSYWRGRHDAYADAHRVIDIAADMAQDRANRVTLALKAAACADHNLGTDHYACQACHSPMGHAEANELLEALQ